MSLAARLIEWLLAPLLSIWLVSLGISFMSARTTVDTVLDDGLSAVATMLIAEWQQRINGNTWQPFPSDTTRRWMNIAPKTPVTFLIVDSKGLPLAGDPELQPFLRETVDGDRPLLAPTAATDFRVVDGFNTVIDDDVWRFVRLRFEVAGSTYTVGVAQSRERQDAVSRVATLHEAVAQTATLLVAFYLLWYGLTYVAQPMKVLKTHLDTRGADDLSPLPEQLAPEEIAPLIASVNSLMQRLQTSINAQKRFIANAAHQLRTPVAALRTLSELAASMPDGPDRVQSMNRLIATGERVSHLATQLLTLVRAESAGTTRLSVPVELRGLCESVAHDVVPHALEREIEFSLEGVEQDVNVTGDATLIGELVRNLLDNAFKYTPRRGTVVLTVLGGGAEPASILIDDSGPGVPVSEQGRIFAPFARFAQVDADTGNPIAGTGLGLAIVREVADAHGAAVNVERSSLGGARFVVSFASERRQKSVSAPA
jgi:two-component system, OmpR family, sensor histidine kinase TctE